MVRGISFSFRRSKWGKLSVWKSRQEGSGESEDDPLSVEFQEQVRLSITIDSRPMTVTVGVALSLCPGSSARRANIEYFASEFSVYQSNLSFCARFRQHRSWTMKFLSSYTTNENLFDCHGCLPVLSKCLNQGSRDWRKRSSVRSFHMVEAFFRHYEKVLTKQSERH